MPNASAKAVAGASREIVAQALVPPLDEDLLYRRDVEGEDLEDDERPPPPACSEVESS